MSKPELTYYSLFNHIDYESKKNYAVGGGHVRRGVQSECTDEG